MAFFKRGAFELPLVKDFLLLLINECIFSDKPKPAMIGKPRCPCLSEDFLSFYMSPRPIFKIDIVVIKLHHTVKVMVFPGMIPFLQRRRDFFP